MVEAIELLVGGRADPVLVRPGADEAWVEGRFVDADGDEVVLARAVPADGRSRAYVDGRLAPASAAGRATGPPGRPARPARPPVAAGAGHAAPALDRFAGIDLAPLCGRPRAAVAEIDAGWRRWAATSGPGPGEIDLLRFQVDELDGRALDDRRRGRRARRRGGRAGRRRRPPAGRAGAHAALAGDGGGAAVRSPGGGAAVAGHGPPFADVDERLRAVAAELADRPASCATIGEAIEGGSRAPRRRAERRQLLHDLRRKYGDTLADVIAYAARPRPGWPSSRRTRRGGRARGRAGRCASRPNAAAAAVGERRRRAAPLAAAVAAHLHELAMPAARFEVDVGDDDPGDDVTFLLGANPGEPALPLAKVASGGELARTMLALRLVLTEAPDTLCSTRSTPASAARRRWRWAGPWPAWPPTIRCWSSPTCPRWRPSPTTRSP